MLCRKRIRWLVVPFLFICAIYIWNYNFTTAKHPVKRTPHKVEQNTVDALQTATTNVSQDSAATPKPVPNGYWGPLRCSENDFELYAYSAFYDTRELVEKTGPAVVRIMGTSQYQDQLNVTLMCLLKYPGDPHPEISLVTDDKITFETKRDEKLFQEFVYSCPIKRKDAVPQLVSIVCSSVAEPQFYLPVETAERPSEKQDFAICVCASYDSRDSYQLVEWLELQRIIGVSKITVYNHTISDETSKILLHYSKEGLVDFRQTHPFWEERGTPYDRVRQHKAPTINDCLYRNMYSFKHIIVIDFDEIIIPRLHANLSEMLAAIEHEFPSFHPARNFVFRNAYFPLELPPDDDVFPKLVALRYRKRLEPSYIGLWSKSAINPLACTRMHHHYCWGRTKLYERKGHKLEVHIKFGMSHHYKPYCETSTGEKCAKSMEPHFQDDTVLRFQDKLIPRVSEQLEKLGLDPLRDETSREQALNIKVDHVNVVF